MSREMRMWALRGNKYDTLGTLVPKGTSWSPRVVLSNIWYAGIVHFEKTEWELFGAKIVGSAKYEHEIYLSHTVWTTRDY